MRDWIELIGDALREIRGHKLRSLLTLSGIVFGAASVVSMTSLAAAMKTLVYDDLIKMGLARSYRVDDQGPRSDAKGATALRHTGMRLTDLDALRALPGVASVHGRNWGDEQVVNAPADRRRVRIDGVDAGYLELQNWRIVAGRGIRPLDVENRARVAVLGEEMSRNLFGNVGPLGKTITIDGVRFLVIGIVAPNFRLPTSATCCAAARHWCGSGTAAPRISRSGTRPPKCCPISRWRTTSWVGGTR